MDFGKCLQSESVKNFMKIDLLISCILNFEKQLLPASCLAAWNESAPVFHENFLKSAEKI